jgi:F-type H+-transporting ATPase subunit delta
MKISKTATLAARRLFRSCQINGRLDEAKLSGIIRELGATQPREFRSVLVGLKRLVRLDLERRQVKIESATELDSASRERVVAGLAEKYGSDLSFEYKVTPELLGGLKIRVGNDVFDGSVKGRLARLAQAF